MRKASKLESVLLVPETAVITRLTGSGHTYLEVRNGDLEPHLSYNGIPGVVGCWTFFGDMKIHHAVEDGSCCEQADYVAHPTFLCHGCNRRVGFCMGCSDDEPDLCDDCRSTLNYLQKSVLASPV